MNGHTRFVSATIAVVLFSASATLAQDWPEIYDPLVLRALNLEMSDADWQTIQHDETFDIEVPTMLWNESDAHRAFGEGSLRSAHALSAPAALVDIFWIRGSGESDSLYVSSDSGLSWLAVGGVPASDVVAQGRRGGKPD
jgi:hypothetical protein